GITRNNVSFRDLDEDTYGNINLLKDRISAENKEDGVEEKEEKDRLVSENADREVEGTFAVDEVWMYFNEGTEGSEEKKKIISVSNGILLRFEDAEEIPAVVMRDHEGPNQYWGIGEI